MSEKRNLTTKETFALAFCFDLYPNSVFNNGSIFVMNVDPLIKKAIEFSRIKIINFFFQIIESILFWYYSKTFKKRKKINGKFFSYLQLFLGSKVHALYRRKRHEILSETLDSNSKIDNKVYELTNKSYVKLFNIDPTEVKHVVEYFYKQKIYTSHSPHDDASPSKLISIQTFLNTEEYSYGSFDVQTSLNSSVVKKLCSTELIWNIAKKYLGSNKVRIYALNTMLSKKSKKEYYVNNLHVDFDCANMVTFFIYWTNTSKLNGATRILPGSHLLLYDRRLANYVSEPLLVHLDDKAGSVFAIDTWALHAGNPNITSPRLVTWIRFSSMPAQTYYISRNYLFKDKLNKINEDKFLL